MNQGLVQNGHMSAASQALTSNYSEPGIIKRQITCLDQIHGLCPIISLALLKLLFLLEQSGSIQIITCKWTKVLISEMLILSL
jgi:hypothetical protein